MTPADFRHLCCREYISQRGIGDPAACEIAHRQLSAKLRDWLSSRAISGFKVRSLSCEEDFLEEDLETTDILDLIDGKLPVVWANVTFVPPQFTGLNRSSFESEFDLILSNENTLYE
ncbi:MAG: hypothetical protein ACRC8S_03175 [Fimbriiglobus sp.]